MCHQKALWNVFSAAVQILLLPFFQQCEGEVVCNVEDQDAVSSSWILYECFNHKTIDWFGLGHHFSS